MATIVLLDQSNLDLRSVKNLALGGKESSLINLGYALRDLGHVVYFGTNFPRQDETEYQGIICRSLDLFKKIPIKGKVDLLVANQSAELLYVMKARRYALWLHNDPKLLWKKSRAYRRLILSPRVIRTKVLLSGDFHYSLWSKNVLIRKFLCRIIPLGLNSVFLENRIQLTTPPNPVVVYTSDADRGLSAILAVWVSYIFPRAPHAKLFVYGSSENTGIEYTRNIKAKKRFYLDLARSLDRYGVIVNDSLPANELSLAIRRARALAYYPNIDETYCLAVAEAQSLGVPAVVENKGALPERVSSDNTGYVVAGLQDLAEKLLAIISDDELWERLHGNCLNTPSRDWNQYAVDLLTLFGIKK